MPTHSLAADEAVNLLDNEQPWQTSAWRDNAAMELDPSRGLGGQPSWRLSSRVENDLRVSKRIPVEAGRYYRFSAAIKTEGVSGPVGANLSVYGSYAYSRQTLTGDSPWVRVEQVFRAVQDEEVEFALRLGYWNATATGTAWFSDPRLEPLDDWQGDYQVIERGPADPEYSSGALRYVAFFCFVPFLYAYLAVLRQQALTPISSAGPPSPRLRLQLGLLLLSALGLRLIFVDDMGYLPLLQLYQAWALNLAGSPFSASEHLPYVAEMGGPLWLYWLSAVGGVVQANLLEARPLFTVLLKLPALLAELLLIYLLLARLSHRLPRHQFWWQACFLAFNPALMMVTVFWGGPLAVAALALLLSLLWAGGGRPLLAALALATALASHWLMLIFLPLVLWRMTRARNWLAAGLFVLILGAALAALYPPLWQVLVQAQTSLPHRFAQAAVPDYSLLAFMSSFDAILPWLGMAAMAVMGGMLGLRSGVGHADPAPARGGYPGAFYLALVAALLLPWGQDLMLYLAIALSLPLLTRGGYYRWAFLIISVLLFLKQTVLLGVIVLAGESVSDSGMLAWLVPAVLLGLLCAAMGRGVRAWGFSPAPAHAAAHARQSLADDSGIETPFRLRRLDYAAVLLLWLGGLALLLFNLGERAYPTQGYSTPAAGTVLEVELERPQAIRQIRVYTGSNGAGAVRFEGWTGDKWLPMWRQAGGRLRYEGANEYRSTYKLLRKTIHSDKPVQRLRVTLRGDGFDVNEITLMGLDDRPVVPAQLILADGQVLAPNAHPLFDEQDRIGRSISSEAMTVWDEVFYARSAQQLLQGEIPFEKTHPPLGKGLIAIGIQLFEMTPFGWRVVDAVFVSLLPVLLFIGGRWLTGRRSGAYLAAILAVFEPMFFIHGRWANIDALLVVFLTASCLALYRWYMLGGGRIQRANVAWLLAGGALFGLALSVKWSALFTGFAFFVLYVIAKGFEWARARRWRTVGVAAVQGPKNPGFSLDVGWWALSLVLVPLIVYYLSHAQFVQTAPGQPGILSPSGAAAFVDQQTFVWSFHSGKHDSHGASSLFLSWPFMWRPVSMFSSGAAGEGMRASLNMLGNPLIWWPGFVVMVGLAWIALKGRNKPAVFLAGIYFIQCLPWLLIDRTTFIYHYFEFLPFVILALAYGISRLDLRKRWTRGAVVLYLCAVIAGFAAYYPLVTATPVPIEYVNALRIFPPWSVL